MLLQGAITTQIAKKDTTFNNLIRRPESTLNLGLGYQISNNLYVSTNLRSIGKRTDRFYNSTTFKTESVILNDYTTLDFYVEYKFTRKIKAYIDLRNLTNTQYFDIQGYNSRRFNFMAGLNITF
jgi:vitamin B12 transporter